MPYVTEFTTFTIARGKEARANEWLQILQRRQAECVATLDREHMHFETIFRYQSEGRLCLSWLTVQGRTGAHVNSSEFEIDKIHAEFWQECVDQAVPPVNHQHVVSFVPPEVASTILARERRLLSGA